MFDHIRWGLLGALMVCAPVAAQDKPPEPKPFPPEVALTTEPALAEKFREVRAFQQTKDWAEVIRILQAVLEAPEDAFIPVVRKGKDGKEVGEWSGARREALRLLAALPTDAREAYETAQGPRATVLLTQARTLVNPERLGEIIRLHLYTKAGAEAARLLGLHHLDRGRPDVAARCFRLVLDDGRAAGWEPLQLFQAALAFRRAGDSEAFDRAWKALAARAPDGLTIGKTKLNLEELRRRTEAGPRDNPAPAPLATLKPLWSVTAARRGGWLGQALRAVEADEQPVLPALLPLGSSDRVVYRTGRGIAAVDLSGGKPLWESVSGVGLETLADDAACFTHVDTWVRNTLKVNPHLLLDNSVLGTLTSDGTRVYAVEDVPLPPWPESYAGFRATSGSGLRLAFAQELTDAVFHSRLLALETDTGKIAWEIGGRGESELDDTFFLGPPLSLGGRLYALAEKAQELKLLCLEPTAGKLLWSQKLALPHHRLLLDGGRRLHAARIVPAGGLLLCATNSGAVIAFDLLTHSLAWAHFYHKETPPLPAPPLVRGRPFPMVGIRNLEPPHLKPSWHGATPLVAGDRAIITAPDDDSICCVKLRDGSLLWRVEKDDGDLYVATADSKTILLVGRSSCRSLKLDDGSQAWKVTTAAPAGRGVRRGSLYYVPTRAGIVAVDLAKGSAGKVAGPAGETLGNLVFLGNDIILSQSATTLSAFAPAGQDRK